MTAAAGPELTSIRSPRVKSARQLAKRAFRQRARSFLAEGPQAAGEALAIPGVVTELFITAPAQARYGEIVLLAAGQGVRVHLVSGEVMAELAQTVTPQGILAVCRFVDVPLSRSPRRPRRSRSSWRTCVTQGMQARSCGPRTPPVPRA